MFTGNEVGTCVSLTHTHPKGLWQNLNCTEQHHFVCQYPRQGYTTPQITTAAASLPCPPSYSGYQSYCYKVQMRESKISALLRNRIILLSSHFCMN